MAQTFISTMDWINSKVIPQNLGFRDPKSSCSMRIFTFPPTKLWSTVIWSPQLLSFLAHFDFKFIKENVFPLGTVCCLTVIFSLGFSLLCLRSKLSKIRYGFDTGLVEYFNRRIIYVTNVYLKKLSRVFCSQRKNY